MRCWSVLLASLCAIAAAHAADPDKPKPPPSADALEPAVQTSKPVPKAGAKERLELGASEITGNRELPRVMYVVPWRKPDLGDFAGRPPNSLLDEALTPVDRDVFKRQNRYYAALQPDAPAAKPPEPAKMAAPAPATPKDEK